MAREYRAAAACADICYYPAEEQPIAMACAVNELTELYRQRYGFDE